MEISFLSDKDQWNSYIIANATSSGGFLQSWDWGEFQKSYGRRVFRFGTLKNNEIVNGWQVIEMKFPLGLRCWYVPRPVQFPIFLKNFVELARKERTVFIRVDGGWESLKNFGFGKVNISVQPQEELAVDITKPQEGLLAEMKQKTRYNIRVAEKLGVRIKNKELSIREEFEEFYRLILATSKRQGIRPHPKEYYKKMIEVLGREKCGKMYFAEYHNKIIAGILVVFFGKVATYLHGGSDEEYKNVMATYLLHWKAMCEAKDKGFKQYNFGGVSSTKKSWEGITKFKTGFSPKTGFARYRGVWDLPVKKFLYRGYMLIKNFS